MKQHILYVSSATQTELAKQNFHKLNPKLTKTQGKEKSYLIDHNTHGNLELSVHFLENIEGITPHMRHHPVDLLIYDERNGLDAMKAVSSIAQDCELLAQQWGSDFHFPMKRVLVILDESPSLSNKIFNLGRHQVREVIVAPPHLFKILRWVSRIISSDLNQEQNKIGFALGGGGGRGTPLSAWLYLLHSKSVGGKNHR